MNFEALRRRRMLLDRVLGALRTWERFERTLNDGSAAHSTARRMGGNTATFLEATEQLLGDAREPAPERLARSRQLQSQLARLRELVEEIRATAPAGSMLLNYAENAASLTRVLELNSEGNDELVELALRAYTRAAAEGLAEAQ